MEIYLYRSRQYMSSPDSTGITESIANLSINTTDLHPGAQDQHEEQITPRQTPAQPAQQPSEVPKRKLERSEESSSSGSDTERDTSANMPSGSSSKHHHSSSSSSKKHHSSSSSKHSTKNDDWAEVTEPEERRRIQNRIAQRKFRERSPPPLS